MIKLYSRSCEHIVRIISKIPQTGYDQVFLAKNLCHESKVPEYSARKGLQLLVQKKILAAIPGPGGGYKFTIHPRKTPLLDVIDAVDGKDSLKRCIMGLPNCNSTNPCPMHDTWKDLKGKLLQAFENKTLFDLMSKASHKK
jgi:Rrf2 family protein